MAEPKTKKTQANVTEFIANVEPPARRQEAETLCRLFTEITGEEPAMWGPSIIGFGERPYSNTKGTFFWPVTGFSPRKANLTIYVMGGFDDLGPQLSQLGPHKLGVACLYIRRLSLVDMEVLAAILRQSVSSVLPSPDSVSS